MEQDLGLSELSDVENKAYLAISAGFQIERPASEMQRQLTMGSYHTTRLFILVLFMEELH